MSVVSPMKEQRIAALKEMLASNPDDAFALYGLALEYKSSGDLEEAQPLLEKSLRVEPDQVYAYYQLGEVFIGLDEPESASKVIQSGIQVALKAGDAKAVNELQALLMSVED